MTDPEAPAPSGPPRSTSEPLTTLRGAGVNYNARKVGQVVVGLCLLTLAVLVVIFTVAAFHRNSQINELHHDGVPVTVTVTKCIGLMGGSGSNAAGYSCTGSFTLHGSQYTEALPGSGFRKIGSTLEATAVPNDPALVSPNSILHSEHASFSVFVLPLILLAVLVLLVAIILLVRRRRRETRQQHRRPRRLPNSAQSPLQHSSRRFSCGVWPSSPWEGCSACWVAAARLRQKAGGCWEARTRSSIRPRPGAASSAAGRRAPTTRLRP